MLVTPRTLVNAETAYIWRQQNRTTRFRVSVLTRIPSADRAGAPILMNDEEAARSERNSAIDCVLCVPTQYVASRLRRDGRWCPDRIHNSLLRAAKTPVIGASRLSLG